MFDYNDHTLTKLRGAVNVHDELYHPTYLDEEKIALFDILQEAIREDKMLGLTRSQQTNMLTVLDDVAYYEVEGWEYISQDFENMARTFDSDMGHVISIDEIADADREFVTQG